MVKLMEMGGRPVTLLDGDIVRKNLSSELGFSKEHRITSYNVCYTKLLREELARDQMRGHRDVGEGIADDGVIAIG